MAFINHLNEVYELAQEDSELGRVLRRALKIIEDGLERYGYSLPLYYKLLKTKAAFYLL